MKGAESPLSLGRVFHLTQGNLGTHQIVLWNAVPLAPQNMPEPGGHLDILGWVFARRRNGFPSLLYKTFSFQIRSFLR